MKSTITCVHVVWCCLFFHHVFSISLALFDNWSFPLQNPMDDMNRIPPAHCTKVFVQRDYSEGTSVRFQTKFPQELDGKVHCSVLPPGFSHSLARITFILQTFLTDWTGSIWIHADRAEQPVCQCREPQWPHILRELPGLSHRLSGLPVHRYTLREGQGLLPTIQAIAVMCHCLSFVIQYPYFVFSFSLSSYFFSPLLFPGITNHDF